MSIYFQMHLEDGELKGAVWEEATDLDAEWEKDGEGDKWDSEAEEEEAVVEEAEAEEPRAEEAGSKATIPKE